ncbi:MAG: rhodanese-like domain-containing protein [Saprospiraceae bacterium]
MKSVFFTLVLLFTSSLALLAQGTVDSPSFFKEKVAEEINKEQALTLMYNAKDFVVLDVRSKEEFETGHIENAFNLDYHSEDFVNQLVEMDKTKTYLLYCRSGIRSAKAMDIFLEKGFKHLYHLKGGYLDWTK